jgi:hypothetical protein
LDDDGWYQKIRLHYFLTVGRFYLAERNALVARKLIEQGNGSLFLPDFNGSQLGAIVGTMEILGIPVLLADPTRELRNTDEDLQEMAAIALKNRSAIKTTVGIGIAKTASPITIVRRFLDKIDYKLKCVRCEKCDPTLRVLPHRQRIRVYQIVQPQDDRQKVFQRWISADRQLPGSSIFWEDDTLTSLTKSKPVNSNNSNYLQLSLSL